MVIFSDIIPSFFPQNKPVGGAPVMSPSGEELAMVPNANSAIIVEIDKYDFIVVFL